MTTSVTDMGALTPILYQGAIPVFADVDARTGNVTAETVAAALSERTRAVIVTHLFGNPVDTGRDPRRLRAPGDPGHRGRRPGVPGPQRRRAGRHGELGGLLQPAAGQAHHQRRGRPGHDRLGRDAPASSGCSSTRLALRRAGPRPPHARPELPADRAAGRRRAGPARPARRGRCRPGSRTRRRLSAALRDVEGLAVPTHPGRRPGRVLALRRARRPRRGARRPGRGGRRR